MSKVGAFFATCFVLRMYHALFYDVGSLIRKAWTETELPGSLVPM
jgi:hypothetical protein